MGLASQVIEDDEAYLVALSHNLSGNDAERVRKIAQRLGDFIECEGAHATKEVLSKDGEVTRGN